MKSISTMYGALNEVENETFHPNGAIKDCVIHERVEFNTPHGILIPQYEHSTHRNKAGYSVSFYETGALRKISLNEVIEIETSVGKMSAELLLFFESGSIKRLFPLNGQLSAYWEENDEYQLAKELPFSFPFGSFNAKIIAISFYENGAVKDLTFWPKETIKIMSPIGEMSIRVGISLYLDGSIKSIEPSVPIAVQTPIGILKAYDSNANGISGDTNSLNFTQEGKLKSFITSSNKIRIANEEGVIYSPEQSVDEDGLEIAFQPLKVEFQDNTVCFNDRVTYDINSTQFIIEPYIRIARSMCSGCASCDGNCQV